MSTMLLYVTLAFALVLILRRPAQQIFGASAAFILWLLPPLLVLLPWLPRVPAHWLDVAPVHVFPATSAFAAQWASPASSLHWPYLLWATGTLLGLVRLVVHYCRVRRQSRPLPEAMLHALESDLPGLDIYRLRLHPAGPAVLWAPRCVMLLPADFLDRFDTHQRQFVLRHEITHLRRGDALWSLLGELMLALLWFHPLAWLALPRLRLDQELACDERVLRQSPQDEVAYAHTLLHSTGMNAMPMSIPWLAQPQLKERLHMIKRHRPGALRRRSGFVALALLMAGTACVTQVAASHAQQASTDPQAMSTVTRNSPAYPSEAIKNRKQATVVLNVLVGTDGKPLSYTVDPTTKAAPELIWAASQTVMQSHYNPKMENGKPVEAYARVPITFSLNSAPPVPPPPAPPPPPPPPPPPSPPAPPAPPSPPASQYSSNF